MCLCFSTATKMNETGPLFSIPGTFMIFQIPATEDEGYENFLFRYLNYKLLVVANQVNAIDGAGTEKCE